MTDYKELNIEIEEREKENLINEINDDDDTFNDIEDISNYKIKSKKRDQYLLSSIKYIMGLLLIIVICFEIPKLFNIHSQPKANKVGSNLIIDPLTGLMLTKGKSRIDKKTGLDLNRYILDGTYSIGINNIPIKKVEDWSLHTPKCPYLKPVQYTKNITKPICENNSLQFVNLSNNHGQGYPYSLPLHDISSLINKYNDLKDNEKSNNGEQNISKLLDGNYHPYNYGFDGKFDEQRGRHLYSFISFDFEFDLLDIYLAENYEVVDYFVIFESNTTFTGQPKPLYFTKTLLESKRYDQFKDKLIPLPYLMPENEDNSIEINVINLMIKKGLMAVQAKHGDLFVYGMVGEIPKPHVLSRLKNCGGWEHLYSNIDGDIDKKAKPLAFSTWSYEYSIEMVENNDVGTTVYPNLAIFDERRSIDDNNIRYSSSFDPYKGYTNFISSRNDSLFTRTSAIVWSAGWDMSRILPTIDHYYNKLLSISPEFEKEDEYKVKSNIKNNIYNKKNIFSKEEKKYVDNLFYKTPPVNGVPYNFDYNYWKNPTANVKNVKREFSLEYKVIKFEIPNLIGRNSICYSYMFDRKFGINNTLWYDAIPKKDWDTVNFDDLDYQSVFIKIAPRVRSGDLEELKIMSSEETIRDIVKYRKSISRFGDGEYSLVIKNHNVCTYQKFDDKLGDKLKDILFSEEENFLLGIPENFKHEFYVLRNDQSFWKRYKTNFGPQLIDLHNKNRVYGSSMISRYYVTMIDKSGVADYIKIFKTLWDDKDVLLVEGVTTRFGVGNDLLDNSKSIQRIICPPKNAFDAYDKIYNEVLKHDKNKVVLLSLGQTATVLAYDLFKAGYQALDMGHADIEYEWFLRKTGDARVKIEHKFVNEAGNEGRIDSNDGFHDKKYESEIVAKITLDK